MEIRYDKTVDAIAIKLGGDAKGAKTKKVADGIFMDFNRAGHLVGIEILDASTRVDASVLQDAVAGDTMLPLSEAAEESGLDAGTLRVQLNKGRLKGEKKGRDWFVGRAELMNYMESRDNRGRPAVRKKARRSRAKAAT